MAQDASRSLATRRVTGTVRREARRLVRLETEHEVFLTTPEHPFATPGSGWLSAGQLAPGDWVVSEALGGVRLSSVRSQAVPRSVPVFNLSVASSHSYFVGTDRVLVHNTKCKPKTHDEILAELLREREELNRQIEELKKTEPASPRIAELRRERVKLQKRLGNWRRTLRRRPEDREKYAAQQRRRHEEEVQRAIRQREELLREIQELRKTMPSTAPRIAELRNEQKKLQRRIFNWLRPGLAPSTQEARSRQVHQADYEVERAALKDAEKELADLEQHPPTAEAERTAFAARKAGLEKRIAELRLSSGRAEKILALLAELAELAELLKQTPATDAQRPALEERQKELRDVLDRERKRKSALKDIRKKRGTPEGRKERARYDNELRYRLVHEVKRLESQLAALNTDPPSESRDARIHHLAEQIEIKKRLIEVRRWIRNLGDGRLKRLSRAREKLLAEGGDTRELDKAREQMTAQLHALRVERVQLRVRERLLAALGGTVWADAPGPVDAERLREFERQLAEGLGSEQQLADIERELDGMDDLHDALRAEEDDVDEILDERDELLQQPSSPQRAAGLASSYERLQQELRQERAAFEAALSALVNEYARIQTTQAASSTGPSWQQRLMAIQQEQIRLRELRRAQLQERLDSAWTQLNLVRSTPVLRDGEVESDLAREIALLQHELQMSSG